MLPKVILAGGKHFHSRVKMFTACKTLNVVPFFKEVVGARFMGSI